MVDEGRLRGVPAGGAHHDRADGLAPVLVGNTDHRGLFHVRMIDEDVLDFA